MNVYGKVLSEPEKLHEDVAAAFLGVEAAEICSWPLNMHCIGARRTQDAHLVAIGDSTACITLRIRRST